MNTFIAFVLFSLAQPQPLDSARLEVLLTGNTVRIQVGQSTAALYFATGGVVRAIKPDGTRGSGTWTLRAGGGYCINWDKGPQNSCTTVLWSPGAIKLIDAEGKPRGMITQVLMGESMD